jgi:hypothetical protein
MQEVAKLKREVARRNMEFARFQRRFNELQAEFHELAGRLHRRHEETAHIAGNVTKKRLAFENEQLRAADERRRREGKRPQKLPTPWRE